LRASLGRGFRLVNSQLLIAGTGLVRRPAAGGEGENPQDAHLAMERQRHDAAEADLVDDLPTRLPSMRTCPWSMIACARVRLFTSRMKNRNRSILTFASLACFVAALHAMTVTSS
jgi:hypothetical protein